ncbi:Lactoylglutathione lyase [Tulasnella sp. 427]|nr:Lactoylglutathione lyase [Tulasnella sp. 427]
MAPPETAGYQFNHTMIRVKDAKESIAFYTDVIGMEVISEYHNNDAKFSLYFLAFDHSDGKDSKEAKDSGRMRREGVLELTHNHGTESDSEFKGYANGNQDPGRGFGRCTYGWICAALRLIRPSLLQREGHIAISVDNIEAACERFERLGVRFQKRLTDGKMKNIAFILDPDGYWIEVVPKNFT